MQSKLIRWGIVGCGNVTEIKSGPAYKLIEGFELTAVMRRDEEKLKDYVQRHQIKKYYTKADDLINDPEIDAIYIATPPDSHKFYALKVAEAGKICCVEKPMAPSYNESLAIYEAFKNKNIPLFVAYYRRSLPRFTKIKEWLISNEIGDVRHVSWHFTKAPSTIDLSGAYNWRTDPHIAPGGYFDDLASHGIDLFVHLLGDIKDAEGMQQNQQNLYKVSDAFTASWFHVNGITGSAFWNFACHDHEDRVEIYGSQGKIEFSVFQDNPLLLIKENTKKELLIEHPKHIQQNHVQNMAKHLLGENYVHPSLGKSALHTSWVMDKILGNI